MAKLYYQGHGSFRITSKNGTVVYVDPYAGEGYDLPANLILVSHDHHDHNCVDLPAKAQDCVAITFADALTAGQYRTFCEKGITVQAVQAYNGHHDREKCVGFVIGVDGVSVYAAGDTSTTQDMSDKLPAMRLDYALLPIDGIYNMDAAEASICAKFIGARHSIPIHMKPGGLFDREMAEKFVADGRIILEPGQQIDL